MISEWSEVESQLIAQGFDVNAIKDELIRGVDHKINTAEIRQRQLSGQINSQEHFPVEGLGECYMRVDADAFYYWENREKGCWGDKQFRREYLRDNEHVRVKRSPRNTTIIRP
jgi:hypothetical protein